MPALCQSDVSNRYIARICAGAGPRNSAFTGCFPDTPAETRRGYPEQEPSRDSDRCGFRRTLSGMGVRRSVVDYGLARRATLASVLAGHTTVADVCDAHPYLLRAAKFHGEATDTACPICRRAKLTHVTYVYGDELGQYAGRVKQGRELAEMAAEYGEFRVYVVEVCQSCAWNHLASSYVLGTGEPRTRRSRRARAGE
jgi:hypothetical protein